MLSSRESSRPRDQIPVSCSTVLAGSFFTTSTTWKAPMYPYPSFNQLVHLAVSLKSSLEPLLKHLPNWATRHHQISQSIFVQPWELETSY